MEKREIIVMGLGNKLLGDDGIGAHLIDDLQKEVDLEGISYQTSLNGSLEIIEMLIDYKMAFILDGIRTEDGIPGDIYFMDAVDFMETLHLSNVHDMDFPTALKLAEKMNYRMPEKIRIIGIEVMEDKIFNESLTPSLREKYADILQLVINSIKSELRCQRDEKFRYRTLIDDSYYN